MKKTNRFAHLLALFTIIVWGSTFISSKIALTVLSPAQLMLARFVFAWVVLFLMRPHLRKPQWKEEASCFLLALSGCTVYFLAENTALQYTSAGNVSIIIASAPILTAVLAHFLTEERMTRGVLYGFFVAFVGVVLVVFNGTIVLKIHPKGDLLSLGAAACWAVYSVLLKRKIGEIDAVILTRKIMFYAILTALPVVLLQQTPWPAMAELLQPKVWGNVLFLGVVGSGICYTTWHVATETLGIVTTNNYIYINPFVTMVVAAIVLKEQISWMGALGAVLIVGGVFLSGQKSQEPLQTRKK